MKLPPERELQIACDARHFTPTARAAAFSRYEAKRDYERVPEIDLNDLPAQRAAEVQQLRMLIGFRNPPWQPPKELSA